MKHYNLVISPSDFLSLSHTISCWKTDKKNPKKTNKWTKKKKKRIHAEKDKRMLSNPSNCLWIEVQRFFQFDLRLAQFVRTDGHTHQCLHTVRLTKAHTHMCTCMHEPVHTHTHTHTHTMTHKTQPHTYTNYRYTQMYARTHMSIHTHINTAFLLSLKYFISAYQFFFCSASLSL